MARKSGDTAHLYDGKTVRSAAPSRKKLAGTASASGEIPKDAIPTVEIPSFVESLLGGPLIPRWSHVVSMEIHLGSSWDPIGFHGISLTFR